MRHVFKGGRVGLLLALLLAPIAAEAQRGRAPDWVSAPPIEPDYYFGIGMTSKRGRTTATYRDLARHRALRNLAMQISAAVSSRFVINVVETTGMTKEEVESEILSRTEANLSGYELVDVYESRTEFWEYYRYSKARHIEHTRELRERAMQTAEVFLAEGEQAAARRDVVSALRLMVQCLVEIQDYIGENDPLYARTHIAIERLLDRLRIAANRTELPALAGAAVPDPAVIEAVAAYDDVRLPARNLPLIVTLELPGERRELVRGGTDEGGRLPVHLGTATTAMHGHALRATIDLRRLLDTDELPVFFVALMDRLSQPEVRVGLRVFGADQRDDYLWHRAFAGRRLAVYAAYEADGTVKPWHKMHDSITTRIQGAGGSVVPGAAALESAVRWSATGEAGPWPHDAEQVDMVIVAVASGRLNRRENTANPFGEDVQFAGEIRTVSATARRPGFTERYRGAGGWNPMGEEMCMDVLGIHALQRWEASFLRHLGEP